MEDFRITIGSLPDRESLVADIFYKKIQVAEISQETNELLIQIYFYEDKDHWEFSLEEFQKIVEKAKRRLLEVG